MSVPALNSALDRLGNAFVPCEDAAPPRVGRGRRDAGDQFRPVGLANGSIDYTGPYQPMDQGTY